MSNRKNFTAAFNEGEGEDYGGKVFDLNLPDEGERLRRIDIFALRRDARQPRRAMPGSMLAIWTLGHRGNPEALNEVFGEWIRQAAKERRITVELMSGLMDRVLRGDESPRSDGDTWAAAGPIERSLLGLCELAGSIRRDGLANPITVVADGEVYRIETGERRWLAYHLLYGLVESGTWDSIPARVVDKASVWRQAAENANRANLNLIGRARQYALLVMALAEAVDGARFTPYGACASDRTFYAQVAEVRIPRGHGERVLQGCGVTSRGQLATYRKALMVPDALWERADDEDWSEGELFSALNNSRREPPAPPADSGDVVRQFAQMLGKWGDNLGKMADLARDAGPAERAAIVELIDEYRRVIDKWRNEIGG